MDNGTCRITTVTGVTVRMARKKTVSVAVRNRALKNDFVVGNIQDTCIIGLNLLEG